MLTKVSRKDTDNLFGQIISPPQRAVLRETRSTNYDNFINNDMMEMRGKRISPKQHNFNGYLAQDFVIYKGILKVKIWQWLLYGTLNGEKHSQTCSTSCSSESSPSPACLDPSLEAIVLYFLSCALTTL